MPRATTTSVWKRPHGKRSRRAGISVSMTPLGPVSGIGRSARPPLSACLFIVGGLLGPEPLVGGVGGKKVCQRKAAPKEGRRMMAPGQFGPGAHLDPVGFERNCYQQRTDGGGLVQPGQEIIAPSALVGERPLL